MEQLKFVLNDFDGPLDLLLTLISKNKMNIYDIPIASLFEQYMQYLDEARKLDMEIAGEFIAMASYLMALKSRTLLPKDNDEEEDPRKELTDILLEYQLMKETVPYLNEAYSTYGGRFAKDTEEISVKDMPFEGKFELDVLVDAFARVLRKIKETEQLKGTTEKPFVAMLNTYVAPVEEMMEVVVSALKSGKRKKFRDLLFMSKNRSELVASFLAILEMLSDQRLLLSGEGDDITLELNKDYNGDKDGKHTEF